MLIHVCHRCPWRQAICHGACACTVDGRDIIEHAEAADCPRGRFPLGGGCRCPRCGADWHSLAGCPITEGYEADPAAAVEGGCGCSPPPKD